MVYCVFTGAAPSKRFYTHKRMEIQAAAEAVSKEKQEEDDLLRAVMRNRLSVS